MNLTIVALYGPKLDAELVGLIGAVQGVLGPALGTAFEAYGIEQVHGTIIGLEGVRAGDRVIHSNFARRRPSPEPLRLRRAIEIAASMQPFEVRIGGFEDGAAYPFTSRGLHPYLRSFSIQGEIAVVMGWPVEGDAFPLRLDELRRRFVEAHALHAYHAAAEDVDNDFYLALGRIQRSKAGAVDLPLLQERTRRVVAQREPVRVRIDASCLRVVAYTDARLPCADSQAFRLEDALGNAAELLRLYDELPAG
jgi:hypothetical protein